MTTGRSLNRRKDHRQRKNIPDQIAAPEIRTGKLEIAMLIKFQACQEPHELVPCKVDIKESSGAYKETPFRLSHIDIQLKYLLDNEVVM